MANGNVRQGRSTNRPEHYGNFECRQDLHENSRLGNIPVNSRVCRKSHVFAFSVLSHVRFFRHFHKACHIRRICRIVSQTISGDPSCAANMFPLLFGRQETACSSATSVRPVPRPINWRIISALPLWFPVSGPMLRLFHIVLVLGNRVKILKLPLYSIQFLHQITTPIRRRESRAALYSIQFLHQITTGWIVIVTNHALYSIQFLHQITTFNAMPFLAFWLYSIQFLHQITTVQPKQHQVQGLYSIQFLHQITTPLWINNPRYCCIVSNFYIKSQPFNDTVICLSCCIVSNFYIKSQRNTSAFDVGLCCIVSNFYIKSQRNHFRTFVVFRCIVSNFYIKSQPDGHSSDSRYGCIVSNFYIKSQQLKFL